MARYALAPLLAVLLYATPLAAFFQAQATSGTLQGFIRDESGAVISGAQIEIRQVETGLSRELMTDTSGYYRAVSLPSGTYEITAIQSGFGRTRQSAVALSLGQALDGVSWEHRSRQLSPAQVRRDILPAPPHD